MMCPMNRYSAQKQFWKAAKQQQLQQQQRLGGNGFPPGIGPMGPTTIVGPPMATDTVLIKRLHVSAFLIIKNVSYSYFVIVKFCSNCIYQFFVLLNGNLACR